MQFTIAQDEKNLLIQSIKIKRENVFPEGEKELNKVQRFANKVHPLTKEKVIQRELLFSDGDTLDLDLIAETERKLRNYGFLGSAEILIDTLDGGDVSVLVRTVDQWSFIPSVEIESGGGLVGFGASVCRHEDTKHGRGSKRSFN
jgi:outer membrane protein assembly factor BamA